MIRFIWGITGAGDLLSETVLEMKKLAERQQMVLATVLSRAAAFVVHKYGLLETINDISESVDVEKNANTPFVAGALQTGKYRGLILAPTTANTVAKIVHGIADTVLTNAVAMTNKTDNPVFVLPVDRKIGPTLTTLPDGSKMKLNIRRVDARNTDVLRRMDGITVLDHPRELPGILGQLNSRRAGLTGNCKLK
jgi:archaeoflavoprotein AfpA